jgi:hypothetical protein
MKKLFLTLALVLTVLSVDLKAQSEELKVSAAVINYVDALYEVKPELIAESVHPDLHKFGYWKAKDATDYDEGSSMSYDQLVALAGKWNAKGWLPENAPRHITIFEVLDKTAIAKLEAWWGTDYFQLAKIDGRWMIMNILWQGPPQTLEITSNEGD